MKKICLLIVIICCSSCYQDYYDEYDYYNENYYHRQQYIDPPIWIRGIWKDSKDRMFQFTKDDLLYKYPMQKYSSAADEIFDYESYYFNEYSSYQTPNVQEVELIDYYSIKYNCINAPSKKFMFTRISDTQIESTGFMPGIYYKQ